MRFFFISANSVLRDKLSECKDGMIRMVQVGIQNGKRVLKKKRNVLPGSLRMSDPTVNSGA